MQPAVLAALGDIQDIRRHVLAHHEPRFAAGALPAADAEAVALAQGVIHDALVLTDQHPVRRAHFPRAGMYCDRKLRKSRSPMKQIPVESFFACVGNAALRASSRTCDLSMEPSGNSVAASARWPSACRK